MGVPDIQQAAKATDNFGLLKSSLEQCEQYINRKICMSIKVKNIGN